MRLLVDYCAPSSLVKALGDAGHELVVVEGTDSDLDVVRRANETRRVVITLDKDFGELIIAKGEPHSGVLRCAEFAIDRMIAVCLRVLADHGAELEAGALITVEAGRVRIRPPDR